MAPREVFARFVAAILALMAQDPGVERDVQRDPGLAGWDPWPHSGGRR
jgi:hypothetical protein